MRKRMLCRTIWTQFSGFIIILSFFYWYSKRIDHLKGCAGFSELKSVQQKLADKEAMLEQSQSAMNEELIQEKEEEMRQAEKRWESEKELLGQQLQDSCARLDRTEQAANRRELLLKEEVKHLQMVEKHF